MIALSISSFYNTSYGVFFVVYPIMLLSLVPVFNRHVAKQFIFSASLNCVEMVIIIGYLSQWPAIMTLVVFALYVMRFRFMSKGPLFLFGHGRGVPERDAQLYELPHHQLAHAFVFQHRSQRDGGVPERADELSPAGRGAPQAAAAD
jgi:hypothetical protein